MFRCLSQNDPPHKDEVEVPTNPNRNFHIYLHTHKAGRDVIVNTATEPKLLYLLVLVFSDHPLLVLVFSDHPLLQ
jgi:hypothetical protein